MLYPYPSFLVAACLGALALTGCDDSSSAGDTGPTKPVVILSATLPTQTLTPDNTYLLRGFVYVEAGSTLTIKPGTVIKGDRPTSGTLIIRPGARLLADGTAAQPIVFTSNQAPGERRPGDWGGVVLSGLAPTNQVGGTGVVEGGLTVTYGGTNATDDSGILRFVRIEFAGVPTIPGNELNGLTLAGVGSGTVVDHVQVSFSGDDAFEWFGGTVNAKHLVALRTTDDMFDTDNGFSGKVQYVLGIADPNASDQAGSSNGFESDNDATGSTNSPQTQAQFANVTLIGPLATPDAEVGPFGGRFGSGALLRRNSTQSLYNVVVAGWPKGVTVDGAASEANYTNSLLQLQGVVVAGVPTGKELNVTTSGGFTMAPIFNLPANRNQLAATVAEMQLGSDPFRVTAPGLLPAANSPLLNPNAAAPTPAGFEPAPYRGAFNTTNWLTGWTNFDPQNTVY